MTFIDTYMLTLVKLGLVFTDIAIVGRLSWTVLNHINRGVINKAFGYYIVAILVVIFFIGLGGIVVM